MTSKPGALFESAVNPLLDESPGTWSRLIDAVGPASMLVVIAARLGGRLADKYSPEDIWQETLLHAWRDRAQCEWRDTTSFRRWLLGIIDHRIRDLATHENARKRGEGQAARVACDLVGPEDGSSLDWQWAGPSPATTPSRAAQASERASAMRDALQALPEEWREVVRLRLFEDRPLREIAQQLNLGLSAVAHRFRKGAEEYHRLLSHVLATGSGQSLS